MISNYHLSDATGLDCSEESLSDLMFLFSSFLQYLNTWAQSHLFHLDVGLYACQAAPVNSPEHKEQQATSGRLRATFFSLSSSCRCYIYTFGVPEVMKLGNNTRQETIIRKILHIISKPKIQVLYQEPTHYAKLFLGFVSFLLIIKIRRGHGLISFQLCLLLLQKN